MCKSMNFYREYHNLKEKFLPNSHRTLSLLKFHFDQFQRDARMFYIQFWNLVFQNWSFSLSQFFSEIVLIIHNTILLEFLVNRISH